MSSIDELLHYEEPHTSHRRRPSRWLLKAVLLAAIGALFLYGLLRLLGGVGVPYVLIFALLLAAQLLRRVLRDLDIAPVPDTLRRAPARAPDSSGGWGAQDGIDLAISTWQTRLIWLHSRDDPRQFVRTMQPKLVELIDERLRMRHGVTLAGDPERAKELLGEALWAFVSQPVRRNPPPRELAALVARMEEL